MKGRFLLDTNVLIWLLSSSNRLPPRVKRMLSRSDSSLTVSVASVWEIILKHQAGKLQLGAPLAQILDQVLYHSPWTMLPLASEHLPVLDGLPMLHKDPFDRLLIAQAQYEGLTVVTADQQIPRYAVETLW